MLFVILLFKIAPENMERKLADNEHLYSQNFLLFRTTILDVIHT